MVHSHALLGGNRKDRHFKVSNETHEKQTCAQQRKLWLPHGCNSRKCTLSCPYLLHSVLDILLLTFTLKKKKII